MTDEWHHGERDSSERSPLQGGEHQRETDERGKLAERRIRLEVSHPAGNPDQHRAFEIYARHDLQAGGWVADVSEQDQNEQRGTSGSAVLDGSRPEAFATATDCFSHTVATIISLVDQEVASPE